MCLSCVSESYCACACARILVLYETVGWRSCMYLCVVWRQTPARQTPEGAAISSHASNTRASSAAPTLPDPRGSPEKGNGHGGSQVHARRKDFSDGGVPDAEPSQRGNLRGEREREGETRHKWILKITHNTATRACVE